jgi:hypothetical protein
VNKIFAREVLSLRIALAASSTDYVEVTEHIRACRDEAVRRVEAQTKNAAALKAAPSIETPVQPAWALVVVEAIAPMALPIE